VTPDQQDVVVCAAAASAICEILGTITVWFSYRKSARVGDSIREMFERFEKDQQSRTVMDQIPQWSSNADFVNAMKRTTATFSDISDTLTKKWWMSVGLLAYVLGATFGLIAVIAGVWG
jgi:hypothetical protein